MSWKNVFNSTVGKVWWGHIQKCNDAAEATGYEFFTWNGWVYAVGWKITNIKVDDLF